MAFPNLLHLPTKFPDKVCYMAHPRVAVIMPLYSRLRPWTMILLIFVSVIAFSGSNFDISSHKDFTFEKYWLIVIFRWEIDKSSFSSLCNLASIFFVKIVAKVSQASLGVLTFLIHCRNSSSMIIMRAYMTFHLFAASTSVGGVVSDLAMISHNSWPRK